MYGELVLVNVGCISAALTSPSRSYKIQKDAQESPFKGERAHSYFASTTSSVRVI